MYYYFVSEFKSIIKINGEYKGEILDVMRFNLFDTPFVEICPLNKSESPFCFMLNAEFLSCPPSGVIITDLKGGYLIKFIKIEQSCPFSIIQQQKFPYAVATIFKENGLKLSIETQNDFFAETMEFLTTSADIKEFCLSGKQLLAIVFYGEKTILNCYLIIDRIIKVFSKEVSDFCLDNGFSTTEEFFDIAKHKVTCEWGLEENALIKLKTNILTSNDYNPKNLQPFLLPYAFLEEFLFTDSAKEFLSENIKENINLLRNYLGKYIGVMPPPLFRDYNEIGLIYQDGKNKYTVKYFFFEMENNKICNIKSSKDNL